MRSGRWTDGSGQKSDRWTGGTERGVMDGLVALGRGMVDEMTVLNMMKLWKLIQQQCSEEME